MNSQLALGLPAVAPSDTVGILADFEEVDFNYKSFIFILVDLIGIEPMTSSMPWKCQKAKLLTVNQL